MIVSKIIELLKEYPTEFEIDVAISGSQYVVMIPRHPTDVNNPVYATAEIRNLKSKQLLLKELEIVEMLTSSSIVETVDNSGETRYGFLPNPKNEVQLLQVPESLKPLYNELKTIDEQRLRKYEVLMVPVLYNKDNVKMLQDFEGFYAKYKSKISDGMFILPYFVTIGFDENVESLVMQKDATLHVEIGISDIDILLELDAIVEIYKRYFDQFPHPKEYTFNKNEDLGYIIYE